jgi:hypothetical protein
VRDRGGEEDGVVPHGAAGRAWQSIGIAFLRSATPTRGASRDHGEHGVLTRGAASDPAAGRAVTTVDLL